MKHQTCGHERRRYVLLPTLRIGFSGAYGMPEWTNAYTFGLMIVILIFRPQGLFGGTMGPAIE